MVTNIHNSFANLMAKIMTDSQLKEILSLEKSHDLSAVQVIAFLNGFSEWANVAVLITQHLYYFINNTNRWPLFLFFMMKCFLFANRLGTCNHIFALSSTLLRCVKCSSKVTVSVKFFLSNLL